MEQKTGPTLERQGQQIWKCERWKWIWKCNFLQWWKIGWKTWIYIDTAAINESYESIQKDCELEGVHLLPQIVSPEHSNIAAEERLLKCERERDKALKDAFHYRTLVEKLETDIREVKSTMHYRVTAVRDFWRNSVLEGRSRSGVILKKALIKRN